MLVQVTSRKRSSCMHLSMRWARMAAVIFLRKHSLYIDRSCRAENSNTNRIRPSPGARNSILDWMLLRDPGMFPSAMIWWQVYAVLTSYLSIAISEFGYENSNLLGCSITWQWNLVAPWDSRTTCADRCCGMWTLVIIMKKNSSISPGPTYPNKIWSS